MPIWGILGIINIDENYFLCVVTEKALAGQLQGQDIFEITQVKMICFAGSNTVLAPNWQAYVNNVEKLLSNGFYYSDTLDLSLKI